MHELTCYVIDDDGPCWRRGIIPDHQPPLCEYPDPMMWQGKLMPMCPYHSNQQRGHMRNRRSLPAPSREWR